MSVDILSCIAGKQDLSSKVTRVTQATQAQGALDRYITSPLRLSATAWPANRSASVLIRCRSFCVDWPLPSTSLATLQDYRMVIGPSWRPEFIFSLLWPFRRSASAAEKFVAEIVKYEAMKLLRSQQLMNLRSYQEAVKLCMWFCVN